MSGGQWLVFWCAVLGLVVVVLAEWFRAHDGRPLGRGGHERLMNELRNHHTPEED